MIGFLWTSLIVSTLLSLGAWLLEAAQRSNRRQARGIWLVAMVASIMLPLLGQMRPTWMELVPVEVGRLSSLIIPAPGPDSGPAGSLALPLAWVVLSLAAVGVLVQSIRRLRRERLSWRRDRVAGVAVWRSPSFGPAAIGPAMPGIVLPEWTFSIGSAARRQLLLHEGEHARAGDAVLLWVATIMVVLLPWNPLLWWQLARLRAAVEADCDWRVLCAGVPLRAYATLLLDVAQRTPRHPSPVLTFASLRSLLGRRIDLMSRPAPRYRRLHLIAALGVATGLVLAACDVASLGEPSEKPFAVEPVVTFSTSWGNTQLGVSTSHEVRVLVRDRNDIVTQDVPALLLAKGKPPVNVDLHSLRPSDIASVEVLKGGEAVQRYGDTARNGVILITLKDT